MVYFCMAFHQHQPVGNFDHVIEQCYRQAYLPFLQVLKRHPGLKVTLHYSGPLLKWIGQHHPEFFSKLKSLIKHNQVELMAGGFYEPILPILPLEDKLAQINKMINYINLHFDHQPKGLWLAERVWEPHLVAPIAQCGLEYIILDSSHLLETGLEERQLNGYYITEEEGYCIKVFPSSKKLRYIMPFAPPEETINYLGEIAGRGEGWLGQVGDDGEKFGSWPHTYKTVYEEGWLERLFTLLKQNSHWINVTTYSTYIEQQKPLGNIYLPTASYTEMMEWALPTKKRLAYEAALKQTEQEPRLHFCKDFLKGGFWRNFLVKYPESNNMHKKMLYISAKIARAKAQSNGYPDLSHLQRAHDELMQGQCNCAYWHGVFGGLYLPHLRHAIYQHLIQSELELDNLRHPNGGWLELEQLDLLKNGSSSLVVNSDKQNCYINLDSGGSIYEWDYKPAKINLLNNFSRQYEAYHEDIRQRVGQQQQADDEGPKSIHHIQQLKEQGLDHYLRYDWYRRGSLVDHFLAPETSLSSFMECNYPERGDFVNQPYGYSKGIRGKHLTLDLFREGQVSGQALRLDKKLKFAEGSTQVYIEYQLHNLSPQAQNLWFGVEFNINPLYQDRERTYFEGAERRGSLFDPVEAQKQHEWALIIQDLGLRLQLSSSKSTGVWCFPIYTVSQAESGYERVYQGSSILLHWRVKLAAGHNWQVKLKNEFIAL